MDESQGLKVGTRVKFTRFGQDLTGTIESFRVDHCWVKLDKKTVEFTVGAGESEWLVRVPFGFELI